MNQKSLDGIFDAALNLEEDHIKEGYEEGLIAGRVTGLAEGHALGVEKGFEIAQEVGFYAGCVAALKKLQTQSPDILSDRATACLVALDDLIQQFPQLGNPHDERIQDAMDALRGKFKTLEATSGLKLSSSSKIYSGNTSSNNTNTNANSDGGREVTATMLGVNSDDQQSLQF